jgi:hypothetical protein
VSATRITVTMTMSFFFKKKIDTSHGVVMTLGELEAGALLGARPGTHPPRWHVNTNAFTGYREPGTCHGSARTTTYS